jgi:DNA primase
MNVNDMSSIKQRIYEEGLTEQLLKQLDCEFISKYGNRLEAQLPDRFHSNNKRSVQVYLTETLPSKVRSKGVSGDIFSLIGYILYGISDPVELKDVLYQCKAFITNVFGWNEYMSFQIGDDFSESKKDYLSFLRPMQKARKQRYRLKLMRDKENQVLDKNTVFSWYRKIAHKSFLDDGISVQTQNIFEIMFDETSERVVFPIYNSYGELVSVKGRYVGKDEWVLDEMKYLYLYSFDKGLELFNLHRALNHIKITGEVIVFEAEKSCMKAHEFGFLNCVAIGGSELSPVQMNILVMLGVNITFAFDNDIDETHVRNQAKQIRTRKCFWIKDTLNILDRKEAPVDKGGVAWMKLLKDCRYLLE